MISWLNCRMESERHKSKRSDRGRNEETSGDRSKVKVRDRTEKVSIMNTGRSTSIPDKGIRKNQAIGMKRRRKARKRKEGRRGRMVYQ